MAARQKMGRPSLTHQLDKEVYQVVRKLVEDNDLPNLPSINVVYQAIKSSNSSLNRRPKKVLEESIERALDVIQGDMDSDGASIDDRMVSGDQGLPDSNLSNRSIVDAWTTNHALRQGSTNATTNSDVSKKKRLANGEPPRKRTRTIPHDPPSDLSFEQLGGIEHMLDEFETLLLLPLQKPSVVTAMGVQPPRGILLYGPPGCGKTMLANTLAAEIGVPFISISAPSVVSGMSGESEKALREYFDEAKRLAPCLMFIDEIDSITPKRDGAQREMEKRIVAQLLTCMDDLSLAQTGGKPVIVMAATNRPDSLDPALRRGGRFDKEINMKIPTQPVREQILLAITRNMLLSNDVDFKQLAQRTPGFVGADLQDLVSTAGATALRRTCKEFKSHMTQSDMDLDSTPAGMIAAFRQLRQTLRDPASAASTEMITNADFFDALPKVQPSLKREGFATVPGTTWNDIGALTDIRKQLKTAVVDPILHPERYARVGLVAPSGVLLWGPPGCGKTLLAKAVANESKANFISIKGPELLNKFVGESERAVRQVFERARSSAPCVIFFDELDALAPKRDDSSSDSSARVVNTLLTELDGIDGRSGIYVLAATNRPDIIDAAMLRPGRLETILYVGLPTKEERVSILRTVLRDMAIDFCDRIQKVAEECNGFSGADMASLARQAGVNAIERDDDLRAEDFEYAKTVVKPSVNDIDKYRLKRAL